MIQIPFKYKNPYWYLIFVANFFMPMALAYSRGVKDGNGTLKTSGLIVLAIAVVLFFIFIVVYGFKTLKEIRHCVSIVKHKKRFHYFAKGISITAFSWNVLLINFVVFAWAEHSWQLTQEKNEPSYKIAGYSCTALIAVLGVLSNIFLNMYEFGLGFDIFYSKYHKQLIPEVLQQIKQRQRDKKTLSSRRATVPNY